MGWIYIILVAVTLHQGCFGYDPEASITGLYTGPYFDPLAPRNLTAHLQDRAVLPCTVRQLGDKSVSWVRMRDADILTVDRYTFVGDQRFEAHYSPAHETWNLVIKYVQERDAGMYECQVSTEPKMSQLFNLRVVVPRVSVLPPGDRYVKAGSKVKIECQITDVVQQPDYIFWYHDGIRVLDNQESNIDVSMKKTGEESLMSTLMISRVRREESGNYTCMPSNLHSSSVLLHVLNEEHPEAMKDGRNASCKMDQPLYLLVLFIISTILGRLFTDFTLPRKQKEKQFPLKHCNKFKQADQIATNNALPLDSYTNTIVNALETIEEKEIVDNTWIQLENANTIEEKVKAIMNQTGISKLIMHQIIEKLNNTEYPVIASNSDTPLRSMIEPYDSASDMTIEPVFPLTDKDDTSINILQQEPFQSCTRKLDGDKKCDISFTLSELLHPRARSVLYRPTHVTSLLTCR